MSTRRRVVSLVPSATETLRALGGNVVGCTRYCHQPDIPSVGGTKNPDVEAIRALAPDLVVVDTEENRREDADALAIAGLDVVVTEVRSVGDAIAAVAQLARAAGVDPPSAVDLGPVEAEPVLATAFVPIWRRPWMTISGDTYGASLLRSIGIDVVAVASAGAAGGDDAASRYPTVELAAMDRLDPDLVLVPSEPYTFSDEHLGALAAALPRARVERIDGEDLFWWGVRTPAARRRLAASLTPGRTRR